MIELERVDGSDGDISCIATTINDKELVPGTKQAIPDTHYVPLNQQPITFKNNVVSARIIIQMPSCEETEEEDGEELHEDQKETVSFAIKLENPQPAGVKLSRKSICFINIEPETTDDEKKE